MGVARYPPKAPVESGQLDVTDRMPPDWKSVFASAMGKDHSVFRTWQRRKAFAAEGYRQPIVTSQGVSPERMHAVMAFYRHPNCPID